MLVNLPKLETSINPDPIGQIMGEMFEQKLDTGMYLWRGFNIGSAIRAIYNARNFDTFRFGADAPPPILIDFPWDPKKDEILEAPFPRGCGPAHASDPFRIIPNAVEPFSYGVCDTPEQVLEDPRVRKAIEESDRKYILSFTFLKGAHQSPQGGWRWHKWGPYIGDYKPQCEYLYDEPEIKEVYVYHIHDVTCLFEDGLETL